MRIEKYNAHCTPYNEHMSKIPMVKCPDCKGDCLRVSTHTAKGDLLIGYYCPACTVKDGGTYRLYRAKDMDRLISINSVRVVDNQRDFKVGLMNTNDQDRHIKARAPPLLKNTGPRPFGGKRPAAKLSGRLGIEEVPIPQRPDRNIDDLLE